MAALSPKQTSSSRIEVDCCIALCSGFRLNYAIIAANGLTISYER